MRKNNQILRIERIRKNKTEKGKEKAGKNKLKWSQYNLTTLLDLHVAFVWEDGVGRFITRMATKWFSVCSNLRKRKKQAKYFLLRVQTELIKNGSFKKIASSLLFCLISINSPGMIRVGSDVDSRREISRKFKKKWKKNKRKERRPMKEWK